LDLADLVNLVDLVDLVDRCAFFKHIAKGV